WPVRRPIDRANCRVGRLAAFSSTPTLIRIPVVPRYRGPARPRDRPGQAPRLEAGHEADRCRPMPAAEPAGDDPAVTRIPRA
ncbi:MAG: hypothetical protein AVDCRST_MAG49-4745, partial [uncultured Thermomicrobiales bacterium]